MPSPAQPTDESKSRPQATWPRACLLPAVCARRADAGTDAPGPAGPQRNRSACPGVRAKCPHSYPPTRQRRPPVEESRNNTRVAGRPTHAVASSSVHHGCRGLPCPVLASAVALGGGLVGLDGLRQASCVQAAPPPPPAPYASSGRVGGGGGGGRFGGGRLGPGYGWVLD